jgi:hypothetical protein
MTTALAALAGFALSHLLVWAVRRAERDPYFCREYARPPTAAKPARKKGEAAA